MIEPAFCLTLRFDRPFNPSFSSPVALEASVQVLDIAIEV
jgi:hypothetical protein